MEKKRVYVEDGFFDEAKKFAEKNLGSIAENLRNNPYFINALSDELYYLVTKSVVSKNVSSLDLVIDDDGKSFSIKCPTRNDPDCYNDKLQNNLNCRYVRFSLDKENNMEIERLSGTLYQFNDYVQTIDKDSDYAKIFKKFTHRDTPTIISVFHKHRCFLPNGIQIEESTYSDTCPLSSGYNEKTLIDQTSYHKPSSWNYNLNPNPAPVETIPFVVKAYRYSNILGLVEISTRYGNEKEAKREYYAFPAGTQYPYKLTTSPDPVIKYDWKQVVCDGYKDQFEGKSRWEIEKEIMESFYKAVKGSYSKDLNPKLYDTIEEMVGKSLEERYQVDLNELNTERKI